MLSGTVRRGNVRRRNIRRGNVSRGTVLDPQVLALFPNTGFTVFLNVLVSVTLCKSYSFLPFFNKKT